MNEPLATSRTGGESHMNGMMGDHCGQHMHKNCRCVRPVGHDGPCNCTYPEGKPRFRIEGVEERLERAEEQYARGYLRHGE